MSAKPTIAFFGATGGCVLNTLVLALKNGYQCVAFARTPAKLTNMLTKAPHSIAQATIEAQLEIVAGDIHNVDSVKAVFARSPAIIFSGIGCAPKLNMNPLHPVVMDQPKVCENAANSIMNALRQLNAEGKLNTKPFFVAIGTTGMSKTRDVPILLMPLYHVGLAEMHADKGAMEALIIKATKESTTVLSGFTIVRPSLLLDGEAKGPKAVRVGWERHPLAAEGSAGPGPAIGYTIRRADVGQWMYEKLLEIDTSQWDRRCVSLTY